MIILIIFGHIISYCVQNNMTTMPKKTFLTVVCDTVRGVHIRRALVKIGLSFDGRA